jgi:ABC-type transporter Mla maintaining outer membrane lipid asymmetry permease subunit MlaE
MTAELVRVLIIFGVIALLVKFTELRIWHAVIVLVAGFYLATSVLGPDVAEFLHRIPGLFGSG